MANMSDNEPNVVKVVKVDPHGDVTVRAGMGRDALDIIVSGTVISQASAVFAAMLSLEFEEGQTKKIDMHSDDPETVLDFFKALHGDPNCLLSCKAYRLFDLARMADMRMCGPALRPAALVATAITRLELQWVEYFDDEFRGIFRLGKLGPLNAPQLIDLAVIFHLDYLFWLATRMSLASKYLHWRPLPSQHLPRPKVFRRGGDIHEFITKSRPRFFDQFLRNVFDYMREGLMPEDRFGNITDDSECQLTAYAKMLLFLKKTSGIESNLIGRSENCLVDGPPMIEKLLAAQGWDRMEIQESCTRPRRAQHYCNRNIRSGLRNLGRRTFRDLPGICLKCFFEEDGDDDCFTKWPCPKHREQRPRGWRCYD